MEKNSSTNSFFLAAAVFRRFAIVCLLTGLGFINPLLALTVPELQDKMKAAYQAMDSVQFKYEQQMTSTATAFLTKTAGTLSFKKPRYLRIEQNFPETQIVFSNGKEVTVVTPKFNQALVDTWDHWVGGNLFLLCLSGSVESLQKIEEEYVWKIENEGDLQGEKIWVVRMSQPNDRIRNGFGRLWISSNDYTLRKFEWRQDSLTVETTLSLLEKNIKLKPELFQFKKGSKIQVFRVQ